ncbi:winged helix-turn-helix domain-containing protein [Marinicella sediminis]|nr:winged helix-turn-helix domain-containing protein [Marinicella sediminis]
MKSSPEHTTVYCFDQFELDVERFVLLADGQPVTLEPKLFNLLWLLVRQAGKVVTQEDMIEQIWQGRVVTSNAISRAVYELRKILDQTQGADSMIKTVRARGYQFNVAVKQVSASPNKRTATHFRPLWLLLSVFMLLAVGVMWFVLKDNQDEFSAIQAVAQQEVSLVILPWVREQADDRLVHLSHVLVDQLMVQLSATDVNRVIGPDSLSGISAQFNDMLTIQKATHANYILEGFVTEPAPEQLRLHLTLHHFNGGVMEPYDLGAFDFPWPQDRLAVQALYNQRKNTVREIVKLIQPKAQLLTEDTGLIPDPGVYRLLITAHHLGRSNDCEQISRAMELLSAAIEQDDQFAYAWHLLMGNHFKQIWICGGSNVHYDLALKAAEQVESLAPGRFESAKIARNAILLEHNKVEQAYELNRHLPEHKNRLMYLKVSNLRYAGFLNKAAALNQTMLIRDPYFYSSRPIYQAPNTFLYLNEFEKHLALLASPGNQYHDYYRALNLMLSGDASGAHEVLLRVLEDQPKGVFGDFSRALLAIIQGDNQAAIRKVEETIQLRNKQGLSDGEVTYKQVQLMALAGAQDDALDLLELTLKQGFFAANYWQSDPAMKALHNHPRFNSLVASARQRHRAFARRFDLAAEF